MNSVTPVPSVLMQPIFPVKNSMNQIFPSGPTATSSGPDSGVGIANAVCVEPSGLIRPIAFPVPWLPVP